MTEPFQNNVVVVVGTQKIIVDQTGNVSVVNAGPPGPPGAPGPGGNGNGGNYSPPIPISDVNGLQTALDTKLTSMQVASLIDIAIASLVDSSPELLNTLNELAQALNNDPNFATTITNLVSEKASLSDLASAIVPGTNVDISWDAQNQTITISCENTSVGEASLATHGFFSRERISILPQQDATLVTRNTSSWDSNEIREPGQAIYDPETDLWILPYTAEDYHTVIAAVISSDHGETWVPHPQNPICPLESNPEYGAPVNFDDPYVAKTEAGLVWRDSENRAHIYVEEKDGLVHRGIGLWVSEPNTLNNWTYLGRVIDRGSHDTWEGTDRTSPVVIFDGIRLNLLYEGRNTPNTYDFSEWDDSTTYNVGDIIWTDSEAGVNFWECLINNSLNDPPTLNNPNWSAHYGQLGMTGHAISLDEGLTWAIHHDNPIIPTTPEGSWAASSLVIDDVIKVDDKWVALVHGASDHTGQYSVGRFFTTDDPINWALGSFVEMVGNPYDTKTNTVMCWGNDPTQAVAIRQSEDNPGIGEKLERSYVTPTVGLDNFIFNPEYLEDDINLVRSDLNDVSNRVSTLETKPIIDLRARLLAARSASATSVTTFDLTSEGFGGPPVGPNLNFPNARIDTAPFPWAEASGSHAAGVFAPLPPTQNSKLLGIRANVTIQFPGEEPIGILPGIFGIQPGFQDPIPGYAIYNNSASAQNEESSLILSEGNFECMFIFNEPIIPDGELFVAQWFIASPDAALNDGGSMILHSLEWLWTEAPSEVADNSIIDSKVDPDAAIDISKLQTINSFRLLGRFSQNEGPIEVVSPEQARQIISGLTEIGRWVTTNPNDWPTFNQVPNFPRYRLRWFYNPTHIPAGNGGLTRNLHINFDNDFTNGNYASGAAGASTTSTTLSFAGAFGQGSGGFGEIEFQRAAWRFGTVPVLRYGVRSLGRGVSGAGSVSSAWLSHHGAYLKQDGTTPNLAIWALSASNNDVWAAGITFILEGGGLP